METTEEEEPTLAVLVGARLKELRQEAELTQSQIAEALNVERPTIAGIERGRSPKVLIDTLLSYVAVLDLTPDVVFVVIDPGWRQRMGWDHRDTNLWRIRRDGGTLKVTRRKA